ncbi:MAG: hypothetical protein AAB420_01335 [Patescibacteria group bacterium]
MKVHYFLLFFSLGFILDQFGSLLFPGRLWVTPLVLIACMIADRLLYQHLLVFLFCAIIMDLFSGLPFGLTTMMFVIFGLCIEVLRKWIRI